MATPDDEPVLLVRVEKVVEPSRMQMDASSTARGRPLDSTGDGLLLPSGRPSKLVRMTSPRTLSRAFAEDEYPRSLRDADRRGRSRPPMEQVSEKHERISDENWLLKRRNGVAAIKKSENYIKMAEMRQAFPQKKWPRSPGPEESVKNVESKRDWERRMQWWIEDIRVASGNPQNKPEAAWVRGLQAKQPACRFDGGK